MNHEKEEIELALRSDRGRYQVDIWSFSIHPYSHIVDLLKKFHLHTEPRYLRLIVKGKGYQLWYPIVLYSFLFTTLSVSCKNWVIHWTTLADKINRQREGFHKSEEQRTKLSENLPKHNIEWNIHFIGNIIPYSLLFPSFALFLKIQSHTETSPPRSSRSTNNRLRSGHRSLVWHEIVLFSTLGIS